MARFACLPRSLQLSSAGKWNYRREFCIWPLFKKLLRSAAARKWNYGPEFCIWSLFKIELFSQEDVYSVHIYMMVSIFEGHDQIIPREVALLSV